METIPLSQVLARPDIWRGADFAAGEDGLPPLSSGFPTLDQALPGGGWPRGAVTELLCSDVGLGEISLLLPALKTLSAAEDWLLAVAPPYPLLAGAWAAAGLALARLLVVAPQGGQQGARDALWAAEQGLSSGAPAAVLCWSDDADAKAVRRLQLAAGSGRSLLFLLRPQQAAASASAAPLRLQLQAGADGGLAVRILKRRGPPLAAPLLLTPARPAPWRQELFEQELPRGKTVARPLAAPPQPRRAPQPA